MAMNMTTSSMTGMTSTSDMTGMTMTGMTGMSGSGMGGMMMPMYFFWNDTSTTILFEGWKVTNAWEYWLSCVALFFLAFTYEWLTTYKYKIAKKVALGKPEYAPLLDNAAADPHEDEIVYRKRKQELYQQFFITVVHVTQLTLSYALMLVVMSYNVGLFLAILLGYGVGFFLFGKERSSEPASCHV